MACGAKIAFQGTTGTRECWRQVTCEAGVRLCWAGPDGECNLKCTDPTLKEHSPRRLSAAPKSSSKALPANESVGDRYRAKPESSCAGWGPSESAILNVRTQHSRNTARAGCLRRQDRLPRHFQPTRVLAAGTVRSRSPAVLGGARWRVQSKMYGPNTQGTQPAQIACGAKIVFQGNTSPRECWRQVP